jgi:hypothetical protein
MSVHPPEGEDATGQTQTQTQVEQGQIQADEQARIPGVYMALATMDAPLT